MGRDCSNQQSKFFSHYNPYTEEYQTNYDHCTTVAQIACSKKPPLLIRNIVKLGALVHDAGKMSEEWQTYFEKAVLHPEQKSRHKLDHATAGGQILEELAPHTPLSQFLQMAIYSHHGLYDCITEDDHPLLDERARKAKNYPIGECRGNFFREFHQEEIRNLCMQSNQDMKDLMKHIQVTMKNWGDPGTYGNKDFYLGMYERLLLSFLIDADRRDTEDFMNGMDSRELLDEYSDEAMQKLWKLCAENLEKKLASLSKDSELARYRAEISETCLKMAQQKTRLYRLTVPTGAGKTLSGLRFAVNHALYDHKRRIIYVAPFQSILEQNAEEIRDALGEPELVLEHHCNMILDNEDEQKEYERITEDYSVPVVVTTAVQFLNTLFADKSANVRRMQAMCDSVIIMDEVQALPLKLLGLFNLAVNFLTEFAGATLVLCTATQPLLDELPKNRLCQTKHMVTDFEQYDSRFRRTKILDHTQICTQGLSIEAAADYVFEKISTYDSILFVVNTKECARRLYWAVKERVGDEADVYHLSTDMYPLHRRTRLEKIIKKQKRKKEEKRFICISTQMIEAGVNISFSCVIRSLAGLDNVIQAAGRCNRHKEVTVGYVYLVRMSEKAENLQHLKEIRLAQETMLQILCQFRHNPESLDGRLDSQKAISMYYQQFYIKRLNEMEYLETVGGVPTNLISLLSDNRELTSKQTKKLLLKQAFQTAGELFHVISDDGKMAVIVSCEETESLIRELEQEKLKLLQKKQILRMLQMYTVSLSQYNVEQMKQGIRKVWDGKLLLLDGRYYNQETGVNREPAPLPELIL